MNDLAFGQIFVKQAVTGRLYIINPSSPGSEEFLKRPDIAKYEPEKAQVRIAALKDKLAKLDELDRTGISPEIVDDAATIAVLEKRIEEKERQLIDDAVKEQGGDIPKTNKTDEEIKAEEREKIIDEDPEIKKIEAMTEKDQVRDYIKEEYGQELNLPPNTKVETWKQRAVNLRVNRLFENVD